MMKRACFFLLVVFLGGIGSVHAQWSFGLKGGYTRAWEDYGNIDIPDTAQIHVHRQSIKVTVYRRLSPYLRIGLEPGYAGRGAACVPGSFLFPGPPTDPFESKLFFDYLEAPLFLLGQIPIKSLRVSGKVGYGIAWMARAAEQNIPIGEDEMPPRQLLDLSQDNRFNRWDHGVHSALGISYAVGPHQIGVEATYYLGIVNVVREFISRGRGLSLELSYQFFL